LGTAFCGRAMLAAYRATGNPRYASSAISAADFLVRLSDPNTYWFPTYGVNPINRASGGTTWYGFCDRVDVTDKISTTSSGWNLMGSVLLSEVYDLTGIASYKTVSDQTRDFMATGPLDGYDYFAVSTNVDATYVSEVWPQSSSHDFNDHEWHRYGDVVETGTVGTDKVEYGLAALLKTGYSTSEIRTAYEYFRDMPHDNTGSFGTSFNGGACFAGYFRLGNGVGAPGPDRHYGTYYDAQGAGTLLELKARFYPEDLLAAYHICEDITEHAALLDQNFDTRWSTTASYDYATKGVIPISEAGLGIIDAIIATEGD
jgi:hypothetical protein